jgi:hypothetical protein
MPQSRIDLRELARVGAEQRLAALDAERNTILALFPDLGRGRPGRKPKPDGAPASAKPTRKRRGMSAAQRKAVSGWMKAYWAKRRAAAGTEGAQASLAESGRKQGRQAGGKK